MPTGTGCMWWSRIYRAVLAIGRPMGIVVSLPRNRVGGRPDRGLRGPVHVDQLPEYKLSQSLRLWRGRAPRPPPSSPSSRAGRDATLDRRSTEPAIDGVHCRCVTLWRAIRAGMAERPAACAGTSPASSRKRLRCSRC